MLPSTTAPLLLLQHLCVLPVPLLKGFFLLLFNFYQVIAKLACELKPLIHFANELSPHLCSGHKVRPRFCLSDERADATGSESSGSWHRALARHP